MGLFADVEILKTATIADLKLAVEHVFSQMPDQGLDEISWYVLILNISSLSNNSTYLLNILSSIVDGCLLN